MKTLPGDGSFRQGELFENTVEIGSILPLEIILYLIIIKIGLIML
jgi:hypothetical protein